MDSLTHFLGAERKRYLESCGIDGGTAQGWRGHIADLSKEDPMLFRKWQFEALMEAATRKWQAPPRKIGEDLFSIAGEIIPEHLTRPSAEFEGGEIDEEDEIKFEKVDHDFATVQDAREDATIKLRKAAQASAAAERKMQIADEARRRAKGKMEMFLRDLAD